MSCPAVDRTNKLHKTHLRMPCGIPGSHVCYMAVVWNLGTLNIKPSHRLWTHDSKHPTQENEHLLTIALTFLPRGRWTALNSLLPTWRASWTSTVPGLYQYVDLAHWRFKALESGNTKQLKYTLGIWRVHGELRHLGGSAGQNPHPEEPVKCKPMYLEPGLTRRAGNPNSFELGTLT